MPLTPIKTIKVEEESIENPPTTRRPNTLYMTPGAESRTTERGLKRLASEAYTFVNQCRKTSYKDVARKLIGQMDDDLEANVALF